jgi:glycosyltransferase involved in cell wall biosynthesis
MLTRPRIAVVIPAFNEERWIRSTIATMPRIADTIVVVDDASEDGTAVAAHEADPNRVRVVRHSKNCGVGATIVTGYRRALALGCDVVAVMAGDGQMHPEDLGHVVAPLLTGKADYVKGDRLHHRDVWRIMPFHRLAGTAALSWATRHAAGLPKLSDSQCGFTAISASALRTIDLDGIWARYGYPNDVIGAVARAGLRIEEVVIRPVYRGEDSGLRAWHAVSIAYVVGRVAYRRFVCRMSETRKRHAVSGF